MERGRVGEEGERERKKCVKRGEGGDRERHEREGERERERERERSACEPKGESEGVKGERY